MDNWISEESRYRLQKMLWSRLNSYLFSNNSEEDGHRLWKEFLARNNIELQLGLDAPYFRDELYTAVCSPLEHGALKIPRDFAEKVMALNFLP